MGGKVFKTWRYTWVNETLGQAPAMTKRINSGKESQMVFIKLALGLK